MDNHDTYRRDESDDVGRADTEDCTTTGSFSDHDVDDGSVFISRMYYRLVDGEMGTFEPTKSFFDAIESAFIWAYIETVDEDGVPDHVLAAIGDGRVFTEREFEEAADADLRTEVLPAFYEHVAGFHCAYQE